MAELETVGSTNYQYLLKYADIESLQYWIEKEIHFLTQKYFYQIKTVLEL